jgi:hypothetical protein
MSLVTKDHLSLIIQTIKKLLSFKADKSELKSKIDRNEIKEIDAIEIATEIGLIAPVVAEDGSIYTDKNGNIYSL